MDYFNSDGTPTIYDGPFTMTIPSGLPDAYIFETSIYNVTLIPDGMGGYSGYPDASVFPDVQFTATTSLPPAVPLFATGLGALGLLGWRRKRKARAFA